MKVLREIAQYIVSLLGVFVFYILIVLIMALIKNNDFHQIIWTISFIGILLLFYGFFASLLWELIFHLIQFKTLRRGGVFYLLLGAICGGLVIFIVHVNIGEINSQGWLNAIPTVIGSMSIMGVSALIFYIIRRGLE